MFTSRISKQRRDRLAAVPLFSQCTGRELERIAALTTEHHAERGDVLTMAGQPGDQCFIIASGTATVYRDDLTLDVLGPGAIVGEVALLDHGPRTATVVADGDMALLVMSRSEFARFTMVAPSVGRKIFKALATRIRRADDGWATMAAVQRCLDTPLSDVDWMS
jgi:CRP/FNR family transcriptional regulator, cyclic AMP receptor protein